MPNGELGIVTNRELYFGHFKILSVYPLFANFFRKLFWRLTLRNEFSDEKINDLTKIASTKELLERQGKKVTAREVEKLIRLSAEEELDAFLENETWRQDLIRGRRDKR